MEAAITVLSSLSKEQVVKIAATYGPEVVLWLYRALKQHREGAAWRQQEQTFKDMQNAMERLFDDIESRNIRVIPQAFNSGPAFLNYFQAAALDTATLVLLDIDRARGRVGDSLNSMRSEPAVTNMAKVQGWGSGGFGGYVHRFVQNEMAAVQKTLGGQDAEHHFFYVWHPDTDWYPGFEGGQAKKPLDPTFGGYHHDLATICLRMRADRQALIKTTDYGRNAVLHLLIPAYYPLVMEHPIDFSSELLPLVITGYRHRAVDLVWFNLNRASRTTRTTKRLKLNFVCRLPEPTSLGMVCVGTCLGCNAAAWGCVAAALIFPPCTPVAATVKASFSTTGLASGAMAIASSNYQEIMEEPTQVLGNPVFWEQNLAQGVSF